MKIIKYLLLIIQTVLSFTIVILNTPERTNLNLVISLILLGVSFIFTLFYKKKNKFTKILIIPAVLFSFILISKIIININNYGIGNSISYIQYNESCYLFLMTNLIYLFINLYDFKIETNKLNYIGTIITSSIIILVNIRYFIDPSIKLFNEFKYSYYYVAQNYLYFTVMYITLLVNYLINKRITQ